MYLPAQCQPVQRTLAGQPFANQAKGPVGATSTDHNGSGARAGEYGIQPSGNGAASVIGTILPILASFF
jgi:hypothetical protein